MDKKCRDCGITKPLEQFNSQKKNKDGRQGHCRECAKKRWAEYSTPEVKQRQCDLRLVRKFKLTREEFNKIFDAQGRKCAICPRTEPSGSGTWHVDHDHKTDKVRGLLCMHCNRALGYFMDSSELLQQAQLYLEKR